MTLVSCFGNLKRQAGLAGLMMIILFFAGCSDSSRNSASGESINIGYFGDFSGEYQVEGSHSLEGLEILWRMNPRLDNGTELNILVQEQGQTPAESKRLLQEFAEAHDLAALLIGSSSETLLNLKAAIEELELPVIAILATHSELTTDSEFINQLCFTDKQQAKVAALFARDELLLRNAAIVFDPESTYSTYLATEFVNTYDATGGNITGLHEHPAINDELLEAMVSAGTDFLYLPLSAAKVMDIIERVNDMKWSPQLMGTDGLLANIQKQHPDSVREVEGMYTTDLMSYEGEFIISTELGKKAARLYRKTYGREADPYAGLGGEAYEILRKAMNRCSDPRNRACINVKIRSTDNFNGFVSRVSIDSQGNAKRPVFVNTIKDGILEYVVKVY